MSLSGNVNRCCTTGGGAAVAGGAVAIEDNGRANLLGDAGGGVVIDAANLDSDNGSACGASPTSTILLGSTVPPDDGDDGASDGNIGRIKFITSLTSARLRLSAFAVSSVAANCSKLVVTATAGGDDGGLLIPLI